MKKYKLSVTEQSGRELEGESSATPWRVVKGESWEQRSHRGELRARGKRIQQWFSQEIDTKACELEIFFFKDFYSLILGRWERRDKERERNIDVREKHESVASHMCPDQVLGMCPDRESDVWSLCVVGRCLTNWATLVRASWRFLKLFLSHPLLGGCVFLLRSVCFDTEKSWRLLQGWLTFKGVATKFSQEEGIPEPSSEGLVQAHDVGELWGPALPGIFNWFIPMKYL